jgi:hypothetical protein
MRKCCKVATIALLFGVSLLAQPGEPSAAPSDPEIERLRALVEAGVIPPAQLVKAQQDANRARLEALVRRLLQQPDLLPDQTTDLLRAAAELQKTEFEALKRQQELISSGVAPPNSLVAFRDRLTFADKQLELATTRARLVEEQARIVSAEGRLDELIDEELAIWSEGDPGQWDADILEIDAMYFEEFGKPLPISAAGSTDLHFSMGFDHTGRYDVAVHPDEVEGLFLMSLLEEWDIPYIAFRSTVPGQATGPHIHIGPPSLRIDAETMAEKLKELDELLGVQAPALAPEQ